MQNKLGIGVTALGAIVIVVVAVVGWAVLPKIIDDKIKEEFQLTDGSEVMKTWKDIPYPIYLSFYIFHITNPDEVEAGKKPEFEERGPYAYRQTRTKELLNHFDTNNPTNTIQYKEVKTYVFDEKASGEGLKENDSVNIINIPFIAVIHVVRSSVPALASTIANSFLPGETLVRRNVTVGDVLFNGFDVSQYVKALGDMLPEEFNGGRFGLYKGENGTKSKMYDMYTGVDNSDDFGRIRNYDGKKELGFWQPGTYCDQVRGTDGTLFPPFVTKDKVFPVFSSELCRSLRFKFDSEQELKDVKLYRFRVPKDELEDPRKNKDNQCFCLTKTLEMCPKAGTMSLEGCKGGAPIMMSTPHFLDGDSGYLEDANLKPPEEEKHLTYIDVEPNSGVVFRGHKRIQVNLDIQIGYDINAYKNLTKDIVFPLVWADETAEIDDENADRIKSELLKPKKIVNIVKWTLLGVGIVVFIAGVAIFVVRRRRKSSETV